MNPEVNPCSTFPHTETQKMPKDHTLSRVQNHFLVGLHARNKASEGMDNQTFLYFAYGSNLLKERLQLKNPSATVHCVARLKDYKLVFGNYKGLASDRWHGGVATIEHSPGDEVWGVVWRMNMSDLESLDRQENVRLGAYSPMEVSVWTRGQELSCRTYIMNSCVYALPSPQYLKVIVMGAEQNGLPEDYKEKLKAIETNKYEGPLPMMLEVERALNKTMEKESKEFNAYHQDTPCL
ncbi:gamma-glutamylcyclotransferase isoform X2 [Denticeps clupeoides]|uniref:gamma-glutamylcyclotransferase isoform X2 n=1 Tax=Denticeps clupeoides TaxID=299321 RepID=UPI0010A3A146|nr:gamma-glutamylcyclotransferase-like isoform X2 [Denticeps clupeoides]